MSDNGKGSAPRALTALPLRSLQQITAATHEPPEWLIDDLLPQGCFLIVGRPKIGKSYLNLQLCVTLACGGEFLGYKARDAYRVVYIAAEDDPGRIKSRFEHYCAGKPPERLDFICRDDLAQLAAEFAEHYTLSEFIDLFLHDNPDVRAIVLDTESTIRAAWDGGSIRRDASLTRNDYAEVRDFDTIAHRRRAFIGLVNHTAKLKQARWLDIHELINRTNTALAGASGSIVMADPPGVDPIDNTDACKVLGIRGRDIAKDYLLAIEQDQYGIFRCLGPYSQHRQTEREKEVLATLAELATGGHGDAEGWVPGRLIAEAMRSRSGTITMCLSRMLSAGRTTYKEFRIESRRKRGFRLVPLKTENERS